MSLAAFRLPTMNMAGSHRGGLGAFQHRDMGGGLVDPQAVVGSVVPSVEEQTPQMQRALAQYSLMDAEKLQEMAVRYRGTPYAPLIQKVLTQKQTQTALPPPQEADPSQAVADGGVIQMRPAGGAVQPLGADPNFLLDTSTPADASGAGLASVQARPNFKSYSTPNDSTFFGSPHFTGANAAQAGISALGHFMPAAGLVAGFGQGFNLFDRAPSTGNKFADVVAAPGLVQNAAANVGNWFNRQFGGTYMPDTYTAPTMSGPSPDDGEEWNKSVAAMRHGMPAPYTGQADYSIGVPQQVQLRNEPGAPTGIAAGQPTFDLPAQAEQSQTVMARDPATGQFTGKADPVEVKADPNAGAVDTDGMRKSLTDYYGSADLLKGVDSQSNSDMINGRGFFSPNTSAIDNRSVGDTGVGGMGGSGGWNGTGGGGGWGGFGEGATRLGGDSGGGSFGSGGFGGRDMNGPNGGWGQARGGKVQRRDSGGGIAAYDVGGGISLGEGSPWWTKQEAGSIGRGSGFLKGATLGRADSVQTTAPSGAYILPADVIAGLGEGNSLAGARVIEEMLSSGPWGTPKQHITASNRAPHVTAKMPENDVMLAKGGAAPDRDTGRRTPVLLSHGEYQIGVPDVVKLGHGSLKRGHKILDEFVIHQRKKHIKKLQSLPGPVKT